MTLRIYDIKIDAFRDATQEDIDMLCACRKAYGALREAVTRVQAQLMTDLQDIRTKAAARIEPEVRQELTG